jgi:hypothetical protein
MIDLSVAAVSDTYERRNYVGPWWFVPLHRALAQFGLYSPPETDEAGRPRDSRDGRSADGDETVHWL